VCCGPACVALLQALPTALVTLTVGIVGWRIGRHQAGVAQAKLKLDLFEKRYPIYQKAWEIMSAVAREGTRTKNWGLATPFNNFLPQAHFLFGKDIGEYLSDAASKWTVLYGIEGEREDRAERARHAERERQLKSWFFHEASTGLKERFSPYLDFEKWR
jgi:hypothetical protein